MLQTLLLATAFAILNQLPRMADQKRTKNAVRFGQNMLQRLLPVLFFIGKRHDPDNRSLPGVMMFELRDGHVKFCAEAIFQAAQHLPFVLKRLRMLDVKLEGKQTDRHERLRDESRSYLREDAAVLLLPWAAASAADTLVIWKH